MHLKTEAWGPRHSPETHKNIPPLRREVWQKPVHLRRRKSEKEKRQKKKREKNHYEARGRGERRRDEGARDPQTESSRRPSSLAGYHRLPPTPPRTSRHRDQTHHFSREQGEDKEATTQPLDRAQLSNKTLCTVRQLCSYGWARCSLYLPALSLHALAELP